MNSNNDTSIQNKRSFFGWVMGLFLGLEIMVKHWVTLSMDREICNNPTLPDDLNGWMGGKE